MRYVSSRNDSIEVDSAKALIQGLSQDGGLFTPLLDNEKIDLSSLTDLSYPELAAKIISFFFTDFKEKEILECAKKAYDSKFEDEDIIRLSYARDFSLLELYHGPTSAFKDFALSILPHLLKKAYRKCDCHDKLCILTATSGDTGKAALSAFADVKDTYITVFYPEIGVSDIQKQQMITSKGKNVKVIAVKGNFDDCQKLVKKATTSGIIDKYKNIRFTSANSINIGRLVPQIVYYYAAYLRLVKDKKIAMGDKIDFVVPTGNFGDILAGYLAKQSGLPVRRLVCASNSNNVLTDFFKTGKYDRKRNFINTISPSMDILVSSNLERLLYLVCKDSSMVKKYMNDLDKNGEYTVDEKIMKTINKTFKAYWCSEDECKKIIKTYFQDESLLVDPHTAVAICAFEKYRKETKDQKPCVILSTASPYKFAKDVLDTLGYEINESFAALNLLEEISEVPIPKNLKDLDKAKVRFKETISIKNGMKVIEERLKEIENA